MAFKKLGATPTGRKTVTFYPDRGRSLVMGVSLHAFRAIGEPAAVHFEWDDEDFLLRIVASNPDDPASRPVRSGRRVSVTGLLDSLGVTVPFSAPIPVDPDGPLSAIADFSEYRSR